MIFIEVSDWDIPDWAHSNDTGSYSAYICMKLKEVGVPIIGGPLSPEVDYSKGELTSFADPTCDKKYYVWKSVDE